MAYTYLLHHRPSNTFYYGVRWSKGCKSSEFWHKYFTSSKQVSLLRTLFGDKSFEFEIRKIFTDNKKAQNWEHKVLRRMKVLKKPDLWLNRTDNKAILNEIQYDRSKMKNSCLGRKHSPATILKISLSRKGKCLGDSNPSKRLDVRQKISDNNPMKRSDMKSLFSKRMIGNKIGLGNKNALRTK
jgi:hypothetical protein